MNFKKDRFRGAMLGLACGDALGTTVEFEARGTFEPVTDIVGGGPFELKAGQWTDDTSMALCLAESLLRNKGMNLSDQLESYLGWWQHGDNSVTGTCFDIGNTVRHALEHYALTNNPYAGSNDPMSAGNGSIMRLTPVPLFYANAPLPQLLHHLGESSRTTHGAEEAIHACQLVGLYIQQALSTEDKSQCMKIPEEFWKIIGADFSLKIREIAHQSYLEKSTLEIRGSGYVVDSLEAALWCFEKSHNFEEGALMAVNLGDDADTTGAVYGQLAGAFYGEKGIPKHWLKKLAWREKITRIADQLHQSH